MELLVLYLWLKLDTLHGLASIVAGCSCLGVVLVAFTLTTEGWPERTVGTRKVTRYGEEHTEDVTARHTLWSWLPTRWLALLVAFSIFTLVLMPSSKDAAILFGAHYAIKASESPEGAKVMTLLRKRVNEYLDEALAAQPSATK